MAPLTFHPSESLVGSLCREMDRLRCRWSQLQADLVRCQEEALVGRLRAEGAQLQRRRLELQQACSELARRPLQDRLALAFLTELTRRPLPC